MLALVPGYVPIAFLALVCLTIGGVALFLSSVLGPKRRTKVKEMPYECGVDPIQQGARERYSIHFYLVAILFILFDLEAVFLFPWAVGFREMGGDARVVVLVVVLGFIAALGAGLFYEWKRRGLEWD